MGKEKECSCSAGPTLLFTCSGASDVGEIADLVARHVSKDGEPKMLCLAGVGGRVEGIMKLTENASKILALDGCSLDCVKKTLERAGFTDLIHVRVTDMGHEKDSSPATEDVVLDVAEKVKGCLEN